jgi:antitoxin MazE
MKESGIDRWLDGEDRISYVYPRCRTEGPMQVQVARWGNSLGLRIPKDIALRAGLREGARVDVEAEGDRIIISPARPRYVLADLLKGMTPEAMREAFDWGPDKGREIVE